MKKILILLAVLFLSACESNVSTGKNPNVISDSEYKEVTKNTPPPSIESDVFKKGKKQLKVMGYKNIKETSYPFFCCSEDDSILFSTGFEATDDEGNKVEGCMCSAMLKGVTIRFK